MNQFAKISPVVTMYGELLKQDASGNFTIPSGAFLKRNEIGICVDGKSIICMVQDEGRLIPINLSGTNYDSEEDILERIKSNVDGEMNGQVVSTKSDPTNLYTVSGTELYNITENSTKSITVTFKPGDDYSNGITITNSDIRLPGYYTNGSYRINSIIIKTGNEYTSNSHSINVRLEIDGSDAGYSILDVSSNDMGTTSEYIIDSIFKGNLTIHLCEYNIDGNEISSNIVNSFISEDNIEVTINYTPIKN